MEIVFREMRHTYDEVIMGHKLWFPDSIESDAISVSANSEGFALHDPKRNHDGCDVGCHFTWNLRLFAQVRWNDGLGNRTIRHRILLYPQQL
jgi:hypothetical protein